MEPTVPHPFRQPVPPVGGEQPRQFLVGEHRRDSRVIQLPDHPRSGVLDVQSGPAERFSQFHRRVGVHRGAEGGVDVGRECGEPSRPGARCGPGAELLGQDVVQHVDPQRQPGEPHLHRSQRRRGFGRDEQSQGVVGADVVELVDQRLADHLKRIARHRCGGDCVEQRQMAGRRPRRRVRGHRQPVPSGVHRRGRRRCPVAALAAQQDAFGQGDIVAPAHPQAGGQQGLVRRLRRVPQPPHTGRLPAT